MSLRLIETNARTSRVQKLTIKRRGCAWDLNPGQQYNFLLQIRAKNDPSVIRFRNSNSLPLDPHQNPIRANFSPSFQFFLGPVPNVSIIALQQKVNDPFTAIEAISSDFEPVPINLTSTRTANVKASQGPTL